MDLTRWTVWLALAAYAISIAAFVASPRYPRLQRTANFLWPSGCALMWAHVTLAMCLFYGGSHARAAAETSHRTREVLGWSPGGEIYFNYAFLAVWTTDVGWRWLAPQQYASRSRLLSIAIHGFLFFIAFNATIIFEDGMIRASGIVSCYVLMNLLRRRLGVFDRL
jgi:hypothetical protein